jgi:hypothetical protein
VKDWATPRWVRGMPAKVGAEVTLERPRDHRAGDAGLGAGEHLLTTAAEDEWVAAFQPDHVAAEAGMAEHYLNDRIVAAS